MLNKADDDLFAGSTMTFGQHLDELRSSLFKAVLALAIGTLIGLYPLGTYVVRAIQEPLVVALEEYYQERATEKIEAELQSRRDRGEAIPKLLDDPANVRNLIKNDRLIPQEFYVSGEEIGDPVIGEPPSLKLAEQPDTKTHTSSDKKSAVNETPDGITPDLDAPSRHGLRRVFLWHRLEDDDKTRLQGLSVEEPFMIYIKAALLTGAILASPAIFYFLWSFVAAGLYPHERHYVHVFLPFSLGLFLAGVCLAFFFVFKPVLSYFFSFNAAMGVDPDPRISEWLGFVLLMPLSFGVAFQLPLVMLFMERIGIFDVTAYMARWRIAILVIAIASMVLSPGTDPYSMLLMLIPLVLLYFGGIALCRLLPKREALN